MVRFLAGNLFPATGLSLFHLTDPESDALSHLQTSYTVHSSPGIYQCRNPEDKGFAVVSHHSRQLVINLAL